MHGWMPLVVLAAACSGRGAELEIHSDVDLERVELFLATQVCADPNKNDEIDPCVEGVGWETAMRRPPGLVLHMADPLVIETALATPRTAVIRLEVSNALSIYVRLVASSLHADCEQRRPRPAGGLQRRRPVPAAVAP